MSPKARRNWGIGILVFFIVMCGMIAWSQWYAYNVNVPATKPSTPAARDGLS